MINDGEEREEQNEADDNSGAVCGSEFAIETNVASAVVVRKRRRRTSKYTNWFLLLVMVGLVAAWAIHVFLVPPIALSYHRLFFPKRLPPAELDMPFATRTMLRTCEFLFVFWFFFFGACIGSFFNVVASRLPKGRSIVFGGSKCPFCNTNLSIVDNMPFFGWIGLRGRCRTCRLPISPRYLIVEIIVGLVFMTLAIVELISSGANLPHRVIFHGGGLVSTVFFPQWDLIGASLTHAMLFAVLIMLTASHMEGLKFPRTSLFIIWLMFAAAVVTSPVLNCIRWTAPFSKLTLPPLIDRSVSILFGALVGSIVSFASAKLILNSMGSPNLASTDEPSELDRERSDRDAVLAANFSYYWVAMQVLIGMVTGWQTVISIGLFATLLAAVVLSSVREKTLNWIASEWVIQRQVVALSCLISAALIHQFVWRQLATIAGL